MSRRAPHNLLVTLVIGLLTAGATGVRAEEAPTWSNETGQTGVLHTTSARIGTNFRSGAWVGGFYAPDFIVENVADANVYGFGQGAFGASIADLIEVGFALRGASNANSARTAGTYALGDAMPSVKIGYSLLPVAFGLALNMTLPTRADAAGYDFEGFSLDTNALFTLDLQAEGGLPLRAHLNAGYTYSHAKWLNAADGSFAKNRLFFEGEDGQLLALTTNRWLQDQLHVALGIESPFSVVTPFLEVWYRAMLFVPDDGGVIGGPYDFFGDAHLGVTPGVRITPIADLALDAAVDFGVLGNGGGVAPRAGALVDGQPLNPLWMVHLGLSHNFSFGERAAASAPPAGVATGQVHGCVQNAQGKGVPGAVVDSDAFAGVHVTTDEQGCFLTPAVPAGPLALKLSAFGQSTQASADVVAGSIAETTVAFDVKMPSGGTTPLPAPTPAKKNAGMAKVAGFLASRDDDAVVAGDVEVFDDSGDRAGNLASDGSFAFDVPVGRAVIVARADGFLAQGVVVDVRAGDLNQAVLRLKKAPPAKKRAASLEKNKIALTGKVPFAFKTPRLQSTAEFLLDEVVDVLLRNPKVRVRVDVYAEALATADKSQELADARADAVVGYLVAHGVARDRLEAKGIALKSSDGDGERRVELVVLK